MFPFQTIDKKENERNPDQTCSNLLQVNEKLPLLAGKIDFCVPYFASKHYQGATGFCCLICFF
jgi:hypothetical protein